jgi:hypothetical protein
MAGLENNLAAEIEFWRDLIARRSTDCSPDVLERMQLALALAQRKLLMSNTPRNPTGHEEIATAIREH